jgi:hypothetical protein
MAAAAGITQDNSYVQERERRESLVRSMEMMCLAARLIHIVCLPPPRLSRLLAEREANLPGVVQQQQHPRDHLPKHCFTFASRAHHPFTLICPA